MRLSDLFRPRDAPSTPGGFTPYQGAGPSRYGEAALQREAEAVATAGQGVRNHTLNRAVFSLAQLIAAGHLDAERVHATLTNAATLAGLPPGEIDATLRSGYNAGIKLPRDTPPPWEPAEAPEVTVLDTTDQQGEPSEAGGEAEDEEQVARRARAAWVVEHLPRLDWHALWEEEEEEEWIIEPLVPARRLVALYSAPKVGKSLLMLELAVAAAMGGYALGYKVERTRRVLYVDFENDPRSDVRARLQAMGRTPADLDNLDYLSFPTLSHLDSERGGMELLAAVEHYGSELVVIDTVSRSVGGEENENDTWLGFYRHTGLRLKQAGVALVRLDHSGKDETKGQRGGSAKVGDVDAIWRMSRVSEVVFLLECEAHRMPVSEKVLTLDRSTAPLRHTVRSIGMNAARLSLVEAAVQFLDDIEFSVDVEPHSRQIEALYHEYNGLHARNHLREAQMERRRRDSVTTIGGVS